MSSHVTTGASALSTREIEVLRNLVQGRTYSATARRMNISPHTVDTYLRRIRLKTGVNNRAQLLLLALSVAGSDIGG
ncbi:response regulator transcription factor [Streptomyces sp. AHA2]|uniref:response regulator transcription factor n=1 Tax=Streptomyces sp. AHA2 TaxID=3064526 RepID=UPI002FE2A1A0